MSLATVPSMISTCLCEDVSIQASLQPLVDAVLKGTVEKVEALMKKHAGLSSPIRHRIAHIAFDRYLADMQNNFHYTEVITLVDPNFFS